jgi:hypothetical protein
VAGARDESEDFLGRQVGADFIPHLVRVIDQLAVLHDLGSECIVPIRRSECVLRTIDVGGEHDAVITDANFLDFGHAVGRAKVNVGLLDA